LKNETARRVVTVGGDITVTPGNTLEVTLTA
jgi:hypothetical protein